MNAQETFWISIALAIMGSYFIWLLIELKEARDREKRWNGSQ